MFGGQYVIIRAKEAGVFAGFLMTRDRDEVILTKVRRIWYWKGAASISQIAAEGVKKPRECKFSIPVGEQTILGVIEVLPCTESAMKNIQEVPVWRED